LDDFGSSEPAESHPFSLRKFTRKWWNAFMPIPRLLSMSVPVFFAGKLCLGIAGEEFVGK
jgi:hypothetical protein